MTDPLEQCFRQIDGIRQIATEPDLAYVARSRIGRLVLRLSIFVASMAGIAAPDAPGIVRLPEAPKAGVGRLAAGCNRLFQVSKTITQPSEPLDARWCAGWAGLLSALADIEHELSELRNLREQS